MIQNLRLMLFILGSGMLSLAAAEAPQESFLASMQGKQFAVILVPYQKAVLSAEVPAQIKNIHKELGQAFKQGTALVTLDDTTYQANWLKSQSQIKSAKAQLQSKENLQVDGGASVVEVETARMNVAVAEADAIIARKELDACTINAPFNGRVVKVVANRYEYVPVSQELIEIVDDGILRAQFMLPSTAISAIRIGTALKIAVHETGATIPATISHIGAVVDPASSTVKILASVDNSDGTLRGGMRGFILFPEAAPSQSAPSKKSHSEQ